MRPGTVLATAGGRIVVATGDGALEVLQLQFPGRKPLAAADLLNARPLAGARFGDVRRMSAASGPAEARAAAATIVAAVLEDGRSLDELLAAELDEGSARGLKRSLCYGTLRWHFRLAAVLNALATRSPDQLAPRLRALLEIGLFQLVAGETAPHAAVSETVSAARLLGFDKAAGFVNAILRRFQREQADILHAIDRDVALRTAHPRWFVDALRADRGEAALAALDANNAHPPLWLRVNRCAARSRAPSPNSRRQASPRPVIPGRRTRCRSRRRPTCGRCPASPRGGCRYRTPRHSSPPTCSTRSAASASSTPVRHLAARPATCSSVPVARST